MNTGLENSNIQIKNIAVCMYGQYRTGNITKEYIKQFYDIEDCNVDYFCSLKPYNTAYTRPKFIKHKKKHFNSIADTWEVTDKELSNQITEIKNTYQPKMFKIYDVEMENNLCHHEGSIVHHKVMSNYIDVIMMKQLYEAQNDITYDAVVLQRYDTFVIPKNSFKAIIKGINGKPVTNPQTFDTVDKNLILTNGVGYTRDHGCVFYPNAQDMWIIGLGSALDNLVYEFMNYVPSIDRSNYSTKEYYTGAPVIDTHEMLGSSIRKINIPKYNIPLVATDDTIVLPHQNWIPRVKNYGPTPMPIRDSYLENSAPVKLEDCTEQELEELFIKWNPLWGGGY